MWKTAYSENYTYNYMNLEAREIQINKFNRQFGFANDSNVLRLHLWNDKWCPTESYYKFSLIIIGIEYLEKSPIYTSDHIKSKSINSTDNLGMLMIPMFCDCIWEMISDAQQNRIINLV